MLTFPDLIYHHYPADYNPIWRYVIEQLAPRSLRRARAVIALSRYTAEDLVRTYHVDRRKIYVVPAAVDAPFFAPRAPHEVQRIQAAYGLTAPYLLHCGALVRRKNLPLLIRAFGRYCATSGETDTQLALTGRAAPGMPGSDDLLAVLAESPVRGRIHLLGQVPAEHLPALYTGATLVVYPSLFEGQGLPPLEAMAAGTPVLASTTPAVAEATGSAAMLVEPNDEAAWANALGRLLSDAALRADLARRGRTVAAAFTWPRTAADTCTVYRTVLGSRGFSR